MAEDSIYSALISPDTYDYLDNTKPEDLINDPLLEEQEEMEDSDLFDEDDEETPSVDNDDSDAYSSSLFDFDDEDEEDDEEEETSESERDQLPLSEEVYNDEDEQDEDEQEEDESQTYVQSVCSFISDKENVFVKYFSSCSSEELESVNQMIEKAKCAFLLDGKDKMFSIAGSDMTIAVVRSRNDLMAEAQRKEFIAAQMLLEEKTSWNVLFICFKSEREIKVADYVKITRNSFSDGEWRMVLNLVQKIKDSKR